MDPDQARKKHRTLSGFKLFDTLMVFLKVFFLKFDFEKKSTDNVKTCKITHHAVNILPPESIKLLKISIKMKFVELLLTERLFFLQELYLEGIHMFPDELQELVDMMTEKEIRVQIPVEELDILMSD